MTALAAFVACARELLLGAVAGLLFGAVLFGVVMEGAHLEEPGFWMEGDQ